MNTTASHSFPTLVDWDTGSIEPNDENDDEEPWWAGVVGEEYS